MTGGAAMEWITPADLAVFADIEEAKALQMIADAEAMALLAAPCLSDLGPLDEVKVAQVRAILRAAILRWNDTGSGALATRSETAGPFTLSEGYDTRQSRKAMFWPSEIAALQKVCGSGGSDEGASTISMVAPSSVAGLDLSTRPDLWFQWMHPAPPGDDLAQSWVIP